MDGEGIEKESSGFLSWDWPRQFDDAKEVGVGGAIYKKVARAYKAFITLGS